MTQDQIEFASQRNKEINQSWDIDGEALKMLNRWWAKKLREEKNKVVSIDDFRKRRWSF